MREIVSTIIGVDCAVDERRVGLALASWDGQRASVREVTVGGQGRPVTAILAAWITAEVPVLLALDAPLGWPAPLGEALHHHSAGQLLVGDAHPLFRRRTDQWIKARVGRQPLDVGADRIARTAHAALGLLEQLRRLTGQPIPLAWDPAGFGAAAAIEVYPAATLTVYGLPAGGYKRKFQRDIRQVVLTGLRAQMELPDSDLLLANADVLDAAICVLAGADFLAGKAFAPKDLPLARKEGWIWVRDRGSDPDQPGSPGRV